MEVCIDNKLVTQIGPPPKQKFLAPPLLATLHQKGGIFTTFA